jgi:hypothetical protein
MSTLNFGLSQNAVQYLRGREILSITGDFIQLSPLHKLEIKNIQSVSNPFTENDIRILLQKQFSFTGDKQFIKMVNNIKSETPSGSGSGGGAAGSGGFRNAASGGGAGSGGYGNASSQSHWQSQGMSFPFRT